MSGELIACARCGEWMEECKCVDSYVDNYKTIEYIKKDELIELLMNEREIKKEYGFKIVPKDIIKKGHGGCCYCSRCGRLHDECVCEHNWWVEQINKLSTILIKNKKEVKYD